MFSGLIHTEQADGWNSNAMNLALLVASFSDSGVVAAPHGRIVNETGFPLPERREEVSSAPDSGLNYCAEYGLAVQFSTVAALPFGDGTALAVKPDCGRVSWVTIMDGAIREEHAVWAVNAERAAQFRVTVRGLFGRETGKPEPALFRFEHRDFRVGGPGTGRWICIRNRHFNL